MQRRQLRITKNPALLGATHGRGKAYSHLSAYQRYIDAFEKIYQTEHVPLAVARLAGKTKIVATKTLDSPQGLAPFHRIAEVYFPSMQALEAWAASEGGKETLANAAKISTGGTPIFLVAEEETFPFKQTANA